MLHLIVGTDRISLTEYMIKQIRLRISAKQDGQILIVPEQFSHETERLLCQICGDTASRYAEVFSFSRMADRIAAQYGGIARSYLDQGGRLLAMASAAEQISSRIKLYASMIRRPEFLMNMIAAVDEFQSYCMRPEQLLRASSETEGQLAQKLEELGMLYEAYLAVCANGNADPTERILWLSEALQENDWARNQTFYLDGFTDFTGAELSVLEVLLRQSHDVWVAVSSPESKTAASRPSDETKRRLKSLASQWGVGVEETVIPEWESRSAGVKRMLSGLFSVVHKQYPESDSVFLRHAGSVEEECKCAVLQIKRWLAAGSRCRDIAISSTDPLVYEPSLRAVMRMADISAYYAGKDDILSKPIVNAVLTALEAAVGAMDYEDMSSYLKTGLSEADEDRCDRLDCYAYLWNVRGSQWLRPFELHPRGFGVEWTEEDRILLEQLNTDRKQIFTPLFCVRED